MPHRVGLFITCLTDQFYPRVGVAIVKILRSLGCEVDFPTQQTCCGQPFYNNGLFEQARPLARRMIDIFRDYAYVVTPSGSCCAMVRHHFPELFHDDPPLREQARELGGRTFEFIEFLDRVMRVDLSPFSLKEPSRFTYHYTCHLRELGMTDQAVRLLRQIGHVEFQPMEQADQCCGFGGTFAVKYPAISGAMADEKARHIARTGAQITICNDAGCAMNIAGMCHRQGVNTQVRHLAEVIAEAMGLSVDAL